MQPFTVSGIIKPYRGDGRRLGYPTANIEAPSNTAEGVFVGWVTLHQQLHPATIFIGEPVTMQDYTKRAEAHILDFPDQDLYGESIKMHIVRKLRDNQLFDSSAVLIKQMKQDELEARTYFKSAQPPLSIRKPRSIDGAE